MPPLPSTVPRLQAVLQQILSMLPQDIQRGIGNVDENGAPPRVIFEPGRQSISSSRGGGPVPQPAPFAGGRGNLYTRLDTVAVHCWGAEMADCEDLQELVLNAARQVATAAFEPGDGEWNLGEATTRGVELVFDLVFHVPVMRREKLVRFPTLNPRAQDVVPPDQA